MYDMICYVIGAFTSAPILQQQASVFNEAIHGEAKPVPLSFTQPMVEAAMLSQQLPYQQAITAPIASSFPQGKAVKPIKEFKIVNAPIMVYHCCISYIIILIIIIIASQR